MPAAPVSERRVFFLNRKWLYAGKNVPGATVPDYDDSRFARITIPHANKLVPWHSFDNRSYEFASIYRRHFRLPAELKGRRVFVDFAVS
jgi:beta-galactosidase